MGATGSTGPAGASASSGLTTTQGSWTSFAGPQYTNVYATCGSGTVIGGGCFGDPYNSILISVTRYSSTTWQCMYYVKTSSPAQLRAEAYCM